MTRSKIQRATDLLLVLAAADAVAAEGANPGTVVFHKILFHAKLDASARGLRAPYQSYMRWLHGPFSRDAKADEELLRKLGLLKGHAATVRARQLVAHYLPLFAKNNEKLVASVVKSAQKRARWNARKAMNECYAIPAKRLGVDPTLGKTLKQLPKGTAFHPEQPGALEPRIDENLLDDFLLEMRLTDEDLRNSSEVEFSGSLSDLERELGA